MSKGEWMVVDSEGKQQSRRMPRPLVRSNRHLWPSRLKRVSLSGLTFHGQGLCSRHLLVMLPLLIKLMPALTNVLAYFAIFELGSIFTSTNLFLSFLTDPAFADALLSKPGD